jgi:hypothetical protein
MKCSHSLNAKILEENRCMYLEKSNPTEHKQTWLDIHQPTLAAWASCSGR